MTCDEFQRVLLEQEGEASVEQNEHLKSCSACSNLVTDLEVISQAARQLSGDEEPPARVWNRLNIALRQEGLIREPQGSPSRARAVTWGLPWLAPLAATSLLILGLLVYQRGGIEPQNAQQLQATNPATTNLQSEALPPEQDQLLKVVEARAPSLRAAYESELKAVNAYVRDAEWSARRDPNDELAQQYLTNAYEQRAMVYEMAMDRGRP